MSIDQVLLIAGTHGNEINAPWIFDQWSKNPDLIDTYKFNVLNRPWHIIASPINNQIYIVLKGPAGAIDDIKIKINGAYAIEHASRGQARTAVLSLKLAEADYLKKIRQTEPILLMDDLLSELDVNRKKLVMDYISNYEQCIATSAETNLEINLSLSNVNKIIVENGNILKG